MSIFDVIAARASGKGLTDLHPEVLDREPILRLNSEEESTVSTYSSFAQNATDYQRQVWVHKAIKVLSDNLSPLPVKVIKGEGADAKFINHPLMQLLSNPNPDQGPADLWKAWVTDMMLGGEWGIEVVWSKSGKKPVEFWGHQPTEFSITPENKRYRKIAYYKVDDGLGDPYLLTPDKFIHLKFYNPSNRWRGLAPISAVRMSVVIDQLAQAWTRLFFRNQARPDYAIIAPEGLTATERKEIESELMSKFNGGGAHKPIILEEKVTDIKTFSFPPKDLEWVQQRELSRDEIAAIFGVPDELMGFGKDTYENFDTADRVLWTLTLIPLIEFRDSVLTRFFRRQGQLNPDEAIKTDTSGVSQLQENLTGKITSGKTLFEMGVPVNVINDTLGLHLPAVPGGDIGYLNSSMVPVDMLPITPAIPAANTPVATAPKALKQKSIPEYGSVEHETLWKQLQTRNDSGTDTLQRIVKREFQRQQNDIGRKLRESKSFGRGMYKADGDIPPVEDLFDLDGEIELFKISFRDPVTNQVTEVGRATLSRLGIAGTFALDRPEVQQAIAGILQAVAEKTNNTTWNDLVSLFEEAERAGEGIVAIQERLSAYFGDRKSDYQTERIARTTTNGASSAGSYQAALQAEEMGIKLERSWISALQPGRTRDAHAEAHGQTVGLHEPFSVDGESLMYPGDPEGSPGNIINCLCVATENVVEE